MTQVEQAAQLEADKRGAEVGGTHCSKTRFNPNVPQLTSSLQIIITHIYISHFIDFLKKITESILKNGHFYDFWAVLARFGIFGPFFFVFLGDFKYFLDTEHHGG